MTQEPEILCKIPCPMLVDLKFTIPARWVCGVIFAHYDHNSLPVVLTNDKIAKIVGVSVRTVKSAITSLVDEGVILVERGKTRRITPNPDYKWDITAWERAVKLLSGEEEMTEGDDNNTYEVKKVNKEVIAVIGYWNSKEKLKKVEIPAKFGDKYEMTPKFVEVVIQVEKLLDGILFNPYKPYRFWHDCKWTLEEIEPVIDNFYLAATEEIYFPINKKTYLQRSLKDFLLNPYIQNPEWRSAFTRYTDPPKVAGVKNEEINSPGLYSSLRDAMIDTFNKGVALNPLENMKVIIAANRIGEIVQSNFKNYMQANLTSTMWAGYVVECLLWKLRASEKGYSVFDTVRREWFYQSAFPQFLMKKGILSEYPLK